MTRENNKLPGWVALSLCFGLLLLRCSTGVASDSAFDSHALPLWETASNTSDAERGYAWNRRAVRATTVYPNLWESRSRSPPSDREGVVVSGTYQATASPPPGAFLKQFFYNVKGLFSKHNLLPLLVGSAAAGLSTTVDTEVKEEFDSSRRFEEFGDFGDALGHPLTLGLYSGGMFLWSYQTEHDQFRSLGFSLAQSYLLNMGLTAGFKAATSRPRPDDDDKKSFLSGHTSAAFTAATVTSQYYPKASIPAYLLAGLVGLSRIEKNKHYLSDVLAGATLGYIVGRTVVRGTHAATKPGVTWMPTVMAEGGFGVNLFVSF